MSSNYTVATGDTYSLIARKKYGDDRQAGRIRRANPGADDPLVAGTSIIVPDDLTTAEKANQAASSPNEVALTVDGSRFRFWTKILINLAIDAAPTVEFEAPFDPDNADFRATFRPFSFHTVGVDVGGETLFTGTLVNTTPAANMDSRTVGASCYALAGVLGDCTAPASAYPIEWDNANLYTIASSVAALFGLSVTFVGSIGATFERVALSPGEKILPWLATLAAQRDLVVSASSDGNLLLTAAISDGRPVANLTQGVSPVMGVTPSFKPQAYYSAISGITPTLVGLEGPQYTQKNTHLTGVARPFTFLSGNTSGADLPASVNSKMGRMFGNVVSYDLPVSTWRDPSGDLWTPNTLVTLYAPGSMIYSRYTFLIKSVILQKTAGAETATLNLVLPGAFAGTIPETLPWGE